MPLPGSTPMVSAASFSSSSSPSLPGGRSWGSFASRALMAERNRFDILYPDVIVLVDDSGDADSHPKYIAMGI